MATTMEVPTNLQNRVLGNKLLAQNLRREIMQRHPSATVARILSNMTDEELILNKLNHDRAKLYESMQPNAAKAGK